MRYRATMPEGGSGTKAGQIVPVQVGAGVVVQVRMPASKPGDSFLFQVTRETWEQARAAANSPPSGSNHGHASPPPPHGGGGKMIVAQMVRRRRTPFSRLWNVLFCGGRFFGGGGGGGGGGWKHENSHGHGNWSEFAMASLLGLTVGLSILVGFVWGILSVTDPNETGPIFFPDDRHNFQFQNRPQQAQAQAGIPAAGAVSTATHPISITMDAATAVVRINEQNSHEGFNLLFSTSPEAQDDSSSSPESIVN